MVAVRVSVPPTVRAVDALFRATPVTGTVASLTVTVQLAVKPPSWVVAVIVAVPTAMAVTTPLLTVATPVSLLDHDTFLFVASAG